MTQKHSKKQFHFKHVSHSINKIEIKLDEADKQASMTSKRLSALLVAPKVGLKPTTYRLGGDCSIQLSYKGK